jgi:hypothetical protein
VQAGGRRRAAGPGRGPRSRRSTGVQSRLGLGDRGTPSVTRSNNSLRCSRA